MSVPVRSTVVDGLVAGPLDGRLNPLSKDRLLFCLQYARADVEEILIRLHAILHGAEGNASG